MASPFRPARIGLALAAIYIVAMLGSNLLARREVQSGLVRAGRPPDTRFMVTPVFANPLRREVVIDFGDRYEKGHLWFEPLPHFRPAGYGVAKGLEDPAVQPALQLPRAQAYLEMVALSLHPDQCHTTPDRHLAQRLPLRERRPLWVGGTEAVSKVR